MTSREELLRDDYSLQEAEKLQIKYQKIIEAEQESSRIKNAKDINSIVGVDVSYFNIGRNEFGIACAILWNIEKGIVEGKTFTQDNINFSYKSGFLGFRECRLIAKTISKLSSIPDLVMCDGHGKIHPRNFGEAVQLGYSLNIPSIGIAKNPYVGYSKWKKIERKKGNYASIWARKMKPDTDLAQNDLLGYAACLNDRSKPVFISVGYKITLDTALAICLSTSQGHRQPEPLYLADKLSRREVKKRLSKLKQRYDIKLT
ncbi:MAG: endonuclease V [Promethearchaeota archaeon]